MLSGRELTSIQREGSERNPTKVELFSIESITDSTDRK